MSEKQRNFRKPGARLYQIPFKMMAVSVIFAGARLTYLLLCESANVPADFCTILSGNKIWYRALSVHVRIRNKRKHSGL